MSWIDIEGWEDRNDAEDSANQRVTAKQRLMSMGLIPGTKVTVLRSAPLGDPIAVGIRSYNLAMRREDAALITVEQIG